DLKLTTSHQPPPCCACARTSVRIVPRSACNIAHIHVRRYADLPRSTAASGGDGRSHWMGSRGGRSQRELPASSLLRRVLWILRKLHVVGARGRFLEAIEHLRQHAAEDLRGTLAHVDGPIGGLRSLPRKYTLPDRQAAFRSRRSSS